MDKHLHGGKWTEGRSRAKNQLTCFQCSIDQLINTHVHGPLSVGAQVLEAGKAASVS